MGGAGVKEVRVRCKDCGYRWTVLRMERERVPLRCDVCREERKREQARVRVAAMRARRAGQGRVQ